MTDNTDQTNQQESTTYPAIQVNVGSGASLHELLEQSQTWDQDKANYTVKAGSISFDNRCNVVVEDDDAKLFGASVPHLHLTRWSLNQLCGLLGPDHYNGTNSRGLPFNYLDAWDPMTRAALLNLHMAKRAANTRRADLLVRQYRNDARAILTSTYAPVDNSELLAAIVQMIDLEPDLAASVELRRSYLDPNGMYIRILFRDQAGESGNFGMGVLIGNGEIGNRSLQAAPIVWRTSCDNSITVEAEADAMKVSHRGNASALLVGAKTAILNALPLAAEAVQKMEDAELENLDNIGEVIAKLAKQHNWSTPVKDAVNRGTENSHTKAGLINGITYAAHAAIVNPDDQVRMERLAGVMLNRAVDDLFARVNLDLVPEVAEPEGKLTPYNTRLN